MFVLSIQTIEHIQDLSAQSILQCRESKDYIYWAYPTAE